MTTRRAFYATPEGPRFFSAQSPAIDRPVG